MFTLRKIDLSQLTSDELAGIQGASPALSATNKAAGTQNILPELVVVEEYDCSVVLPNATTTRQYYICSVAGNGATKGQLLLDTGLGTGLCSIVTHKVGRTITPAKTLTVNALVAGKNYFWNSAAWVSYLLLAEKDIDAIEKNYPKIVTEKYSCRVALPTNTSTRQYYVCSEAGNGASVGQLLIDNGLDDAGNCTILDHNASEIIVPQKELAIGTDDILLINIPYFWDAVASDWVQLEKFGAIEENLLLVTKSTRLKIPISTALQIKIDVKTAYSAGATLKIGDVDADDALIGDAVVDITTEGLKTVEIKKAWATKQVAVLTIAGSPEAGECDVLIVFAQ